MARFRVLVLGLVGGALGCATTSSSAWVSQPEPGPFETDPAALAAAEHPTAALDEPRTSQLVSELELEDVPRGRPRLDRTVTLGEVLVTPPEPAGAAPVGERAPVSVTINNYMSAPPSYYDGYYAASYLAGGFPPAQGGGARPSRPSAPSHPGQDWPTVPSYGPSFPFKTAPASPWR